MVVNKPICKKIDILKRKQIHRNEEISKSSILQFIIFNIIVSYIAIAFFFPNSINICRYDVDTYILCRTYSRSIFEI